MGMIPFIHNPNGCLESGFYSLEVYGNPCKPRKGVFTIHLIWANYYLRIEQRLLQDT